MKKAFPIDVHHSVVYFVPQLRKIGSTGDGKKRSEHYDNDYDDKHLTESIFPILDIDRFDSDEDQTFRRLVKKTITEQNLTFPPNDIPKTLQECEKIMKANGVNFVLQILFHSIAHTTEESSCLGGAEKVRGFTKTLVNRMAESGHQQLLADKVDDRTSAHEFLSFDFKALNSCNEIAIRMAESMASKLVIFLKDCRCDDPTKKLQEVANNNFRTYMGSWQPGGLNCWTEATPFIALFMMMLGNQYSEHHQHHQEPESWFSDAIPVPTKPGKDCYNTKFFTLEHKKKAVQNIRERLTRIETKGGWHAIDTNEMSFQHAECKSLKELVRRRDNWKLIESNPDSEQEALTLFLYYNETTNVMAILGVIKPLCYMIMTAAGFPIGNNRDQMTRRAICAESFRLLLAYFLNGAYPSQDELFNGNILIFHSVFMYFTLGLKGSPKAGSLLAKQFLAPLKFNLMESKYHNMSLKDDTGALSTRARQENKKIAGSQDTRTADPFISQKCLMQISKQENGQSDSLASKMKEVVEIQKDGVTASTFHNRHKTLAKYLQGEALQVFQNTIEAQKANTGNCKRKHQAPTTPKQVEEGDKVVDKIVKEVKVKGEYNFWIKGYKSRCAKAKAPGKDRAAFEEGDEVVWEGTKVNFHIGNETNVHVPFQKIYPTLEIKHETLRNRLKSRNEMDNDEHNRKTNRIKSKKLCTEQYSLLTCHEHKGPFNMDEDGRGWVLAKVVKAKPKPKPAECWEKIEPAVKSKGEYLFWIDGCPLRRGKDEKKKAMGMPSLEAGDDVTWEDNEVTRVIPFKQKFDVEDSTLFGGLRSTTYQKYIDQYTLKNCVGPFNLTKTSRGNFKGWSLIRATMRKTKKNP